MSGQKSYQTLTTGKHRKFKLTAAQFLKRLRSDLYSFFSHSANVSSQPLLLYIIQVISNRKGKPKLSLFQNVKISPFLKNFRNSISERSSLKRFPSIFLDTFQVYLCIQSSVPSTTHNCQHSQKDAYAKAEFGFLPHKTEKLRRKSLFTIYPSPPSHKPKHA